MRAARRCEICGNMHNMWRPNKTYENVQGCPRQWRMRPCRTNDSFEALRERSTADVAYEASDEERNMTCEKVDHVMREHTRATTNQSHENKTEPRNDESHENTRDMRERAKSARNEQDLQEHANICDRRKRQEPANLPRAYEIFNNVDTHESVEGKRERRRAAKAYEYHEHNENV
jgi:hypothetical protein